MSLRNLTSQDVIKNNLLSRQTTSSTTKQENHEWNIDVVYRSLFLYTVKYKVCRGYTKCL